MYLRTGVLVWLLLAPCALAQNLMTREHILSPRHRLPSTVTPKASSTVGSADPQAVAQRIIMPSHSDANCEVCVSPDVVSAEATTENRGRDRIIPYKETTSRK